METNTTPTETQFIPSILHDFKKQIVVLRPEVGVREEISYAEHKHYIGFDLLKDN